MNTMMFYLVALVLCGLSTLLIRETSPSNAPSLTANPADSRNWKRRLAGRILIVFAALCAGIGVVAQLHSTIH